MREIKFKVFDYDSNKMYPSCYESIKGINFGMYGEVSEIIISKYNPKGYWEFETLTEIEILQFTGLKDKNNKEIYEGDILFYNKYYPTLLVEFDKQELRFKIESYEKGKPFDELRLAGVAPKSKIVGNKFENQELLCLK
jgi:hypothetical protein